MYSTSKKQSRVFDNFFAMKILFLVFALVGFATCFDAIADGELDTTFNGTGVVSTPIGSGGNYAMGIAFQAGGKIVVVGEASNGSNKDVALVRYNANGSLDTSFGTSPSLPGNGIVMTDIAGNDDYHFNQIAIQPDGKIVVGGETSSQYFMAILRYTQDGVLDTTFNGTGKVITNIQGGSDGASSLAIQPDGKIVVGGFVNNGSNNDMAIVRYTASGVLDTTFNGTGRVTINDMGTEAGFSDVAIQCDGKILASGWTDLNNGGSAVVRFNTNGSLDTTFGNVNGKGGIALAGRSNFGLVKTLALSPDGKIVTGGRFVNSSINWDYGVVRYNVDGSLDQSFGIGGTTSTDVIAGNHDFGYATAVQPDGKIIEAGHSFPNVQPYSNVHGMIVKYNYDGSRDNSFVQGIPIGVIETVWGVAIQPDDGKIIVAGQYGQNFVVIRLNNTISNSFIINSSQGIGGTITPLGVVPVSRGGSQTFTVTPTQTPNSCYEVDNVLVDGCSSVTLTSGLYTFANVTANHAINATFKPIQPTRIINLSGNLSFGSVQVGATKQLSFTISNIGSCSPLSVTSISYPSAAFTGGDWNGTIDPGKSKTVYVTFAPTACQDYSGTVTVNSNATSGTNTMPISGTGVATCQYTDTNGSTLEGITLCQNNPTNYGLITQTQCDQAVKNEQLKWDANGDGKIGLEDIIRMLQIIAGLRP